MNDYEQLKLTTKCKSPLRVLVFDKGGYLVPSKGKVTIAGKSKVKGERDE
jgi:hypothetical protein